VTLSRTLGGLGRSLISGGVLLLLFVVYQLWGTGVRTEAAQNELRDDFHARKAELTQLAGGTPAAPGATGATSTAASVPPPRIGEPIGVMRIPRIGAEFTVVEGVDLANLARAPGHFPSTPLPGQAGNSAVAGHRVTHSAPFNRIDELKPGDKIEVETFQGNFTYEVLPGGNVDPRSSRGHRIITPYQTEILDQVAGQNTLTLMACHPKYDLKERIVVVGRLVQAPAPSTARADPSAPGATLPPESNPGASEAMLVGGDSSAVGPAMMWSAIAGLVWLGAWALARPWPGWLQWQRWAVFAGCTAVFVPPLYLAFEAINDLLPAGY
jgi:sortase A